MARSRYIKPDFTLDPDTALVSIPARYLYENLWCHMDSEGVCDSDLRVIRVQVFPHDKKLTEKKISSYIDELIREGFLFPLQYEGKGYLYCPTLGRHQHFHKNEGPKFGLNKKTIQSLLSGEKEKQIEQTKPSLQSAPERSEKFQCAPVDNGSWSMDHGEPQNETEKPVSFAAPTVLELSDPVISKHIGHWKISHDVQSLWLHTYEDHQWVKHELLKAIAWYASNPRKRPKSQYANFLGSWLSRGWERERKNIRPTRKKMPEVLDV